MRIILVRHGETLWNAQRRIQGISDVDLSPKGRQQAAQLAQALRPDPLTAVYSSPLRRALETAMAIALYHHLEVRLEEGLKELNHGELEGSNLEQLRHTHPSVIRAWFRDSQPLLRLPGGESLFEVQERAWATLERIRCAHPQGVVAVVGHSFVIRAVLCKVLSLDLAEFRRLRLDLASRSVIEFGERGGMLHSLNVTEHLLAGSPAP